ncbi:MAG TPA: hypothetical protein VHZ76_03485 [Gammaproteobacteria bacterium]|jgi:chromosome segregation ATPase|nr:hypothetical protein [Gammaproteobacteria bacterium]
MVELERLEEGMIGLMTRLEKVLATNEELNKKNQELNEKITSIVEEKHRHTKKLQELLALIDSFSPANVVAASNVVASPMMLKEVL